MSEAGQHENVRLLTYAELEEVSGSVGNFKVKIRQKARKVDYDLCTGCGVCVEKCPRKVVDTEFEAGMGTRKAIYMPFPAGRAARAGAGHRVLHLVRAAALRGLPEAVPDQRDPVRPGRRNDRAEGRQHHHCHRLEAVRLHEDPAVRLRSSGQRLHEPGIRTAVQRGGPDQRQDRVAGRQDDSQVGGHHPLRGQPRPEPQSLLFRASAAWRR